MRKLPASLLLAGIIAAPLAAQAADSPHTLATKISLYSEYEYRGISQTHEKPALQLNVDYSHTSGFYAGLFVTNIKWLKETAESLGGNTRGGTEVDLFLGFKKEIVPDVTLDVGYLRYEYPRADDFFNAPKVNTDEVYIGAAWKFLSAKYSYSINDTFGVPNSEGTDFLELNLAYPLNEKFTLTGHVGYQRFSGTQSSGFNNDDLSYMVYKLGFVYDFGGGFNAGAYYKGTDVDGGIYTINGKDWSKSRLVGFVSYTF